MLLKCLSGTMSSSYWKGQLQWQQELSKEKKACFPGHTSVGKLQQDLDQQVALQPRWTLRRKSIHHSVAYQVHISRLILLCFLLTCHMNINLMLVKILNIHIQQDGGGRYPCPTLLLYPKNNSKIIPFQRTNRSTRRRWTGLWGPRLDHQQNQTIKRG